MRKLLDLYIQNHKFRNHSPHTIRTDRCSIGKYIDYDFAQWPEIFYQRAQKNRGITAKRELKRMITFCDWAIKENLLDENPFRKISPPKAEMPLPKALNTKQAKAIIAEAKSIDYCCYALFSTLLYTGLRRGEILSLTRQDVDLESCLIFVKNGKGAKDRVVPINQNLRPILSRWLKRPEVDGFVFPISDRKLRRINDRLRKKVGFHFTIHQLRHTFATLALNADVGLNFLQRALGHSSSSTTEIYLKISVNQMALQMNKMALA